jgi:mono/diheme cytochrome c family protein
MSKGVKITLWVVVGLLAGFALIQLIPYGRDHTNPPVTAEPSWDSPRTRELAKQACFDCHSNETVWPWYSSVAPVSWLVQRDVDEGRSRMNFSEWPQLPSGGGAAIAAEAAEVVDGGEMPPIQYRIIHSGARLSDAEKQELIAGLKASLQ